MWLYRLRWFLSVQPRRRGIGHSRKSFRFIPIAILLTIGIGCLTLLRSIWDVFMKGFLASTPWVPGNQAGTYYFDSVMFALKGTFTVGMILLLTMFLLGFQANKIYRR